MSKEKAYGVTEIESRRLRLEWSRRDLARFARLQYTTVLRIESGKVTQTKSRIKAENAIIRREAYCVRVAGRIQARAPR